MDDEALRNFNAEQIRLQEETENTQVQTNTHMDPKDRNTGQTSNETGGEPKFTSLVDARHWTQMEYVPS